MQTQTFRQESEIHAPPAAVFAWHERPGAIEELTPPWERVEVLERARNLQIGARMVFKIRSGPLSQLWVAEHIEDDPPLLFTDVQRRGPFAYWVHRHRFEPSASGQTRMIDEVEYALPLGWLGELLAGWFVRAKLQRMFAYRHQIVTQALSRNESAAKAD
ncbi:MAG: SRPBCC family protein [Acidobacteria bacterium]|nr:SRPBCC family protein [Acidobacteriota bacterium]MBI3421911.1 SRPBCC family protein [Acidobacteriota bacterium]